MNILSYGAGAVGLGIANCLLKSGLQLRLVVRGDTAAALRENGLVRSGIMGNYTAPPKDFRCYTELENMDELTYDYILVSTKSFDSEEAAKDISSHPHLFNEKTKIVLFQNGWGNAEVFARYFPKEQVYSARVITGFFRPQPNETHITVHAYPVRIGSLFGQDVETLSPLVNAINDGGLPCELGFEISKDLWTKMLYNCALNSLGAILNVTYGELAEHEYSRHIMENVIKEIYQLFEKTGHSTHWDTPEEYMEIFYSKLVPSTAEHKSSTLQSLKNGKRTEIDALNGAVMKLAKQYNILPKVNCTLYNMIKFLEKNNS